APWTRTIVGFSARDETFVANTFVAPEMSKVELKDPGSGATLAVTKDVRPAIRIVEDLITASGKFSGAQLQHRCKPVLHVIGLADSPALDGVNVCRHHAKPFPAMWDQPAEESAGRSAADLAAHDHMIVIGESLLYLELHIGDRGLEAGDDLNRLLLVPTLAGPVASAGHIVRRHDAVVHRGDALTVGEVEQ